LQTSWAALDAKNQQTKAELADNLARLTFIERGCQSSGSEF